MSVKSVVQDTGGVSDLTGIASRVQQVLRERYDGNQTQMAEDVDLSRSTINKIVNGKTSDVEDSTVIKIARHAVVDEKWLRSGKGEMKLLEDQRVENHKSEADVTAEQVTYPLTRAGSGPGRNDRSSTLSVDKRLIRSYVGHVPSEKEAFWTVVEGESMSPWIDDGAYVFCERTDTVDKEGRYIVWYGDHDVDVCVHLRPLGDKGLKVRKYGPEKTWTLEHQKSDHYKTDGRTIRLRVQGRVIWPPATAQHVMETVTDQMAKMLKEAIN